MRPVVGLLCFLVVGAGVAVADGAKDEAQLEVARRLAIEGESYTDPIQKGENLGWVGQVQARAGDAAAAEASWTAAVEFCESLQPGDPAQTARALTNIGVRQVDMEAFDAAHKTLLRARDLAFLIEGDLARDHILRDVIIGLRRMGRDDEARAIRDEVVRRIEASDDPATRGRRFLNISAVHCWNADLRTALEMAREPEATLDETAYQVRVSILTGMGRWVLGGDRGTAGPVLIEALPLVREIEDPGRRSVALNGWVWAMVRMGELEHARDAVREMATEDEEEKVAANLRVTKGESLLAVAIGFTQAGREAEALAFLDEAWELATVDIRPGDLGTNKRAQLLLFAIPRAQINAGGLDQVKALPIANVSFYRYGYLRLGLQDRREAGDFATAARVETMLKEAADAAWADYRRNRAEFIADDLTMILLRIEYEELKGRLRRLGIPEPPKSSFDEESPPDLLASIDQNGERTRIATVGASAVLGDFRHATAEARRISDPDIMLLGAMREINDCLVVHGRVETALTWIDGLVDSRQRITQLNHVAQVLERERKGRENAAKRGR